MFPDRKEFEKALSAAGGEKGVPLDVLARLPLVKGLHVAEERYQMVTGPEGR